MKVRVYLELLDSTNLILELSKNHSVSIGCVRGQTWGRDVFSAVGIEELARRRDLLLRMREERGISCAGLTDLGTVERG